MRALDLTAAWLRAFACCGVLTLLACTGAAGNPSLGDGAGASGSATRTEVETAEEYRSPENFSRVIRPKGPPGSPPFEQATQPTVGGARALQLELPSGISLLARGDHRGLELLDVSDPANAQVVSRGVVRGAVHQLLRAGSSSTELWLAASEPAERSGTTLPTAPELPEARVILLDVSNPAAPVRVREAPLGGAFQHLEERGGELWVLTSRRVLEERGGAPTQGMCGYQIRDEAQELHGYRPSGSTLEPVASAELPLGQATWWATDGVATVTEDGVLHVLAWDPAGVLQPRIDVPLPGAAPWNGPLEIRANELNWVGSSGGRTKLYRFDLASRATEPRTVDLGDEVSPPNPLSLWFDDKLWLNHGYEAPAELWDVRGDTPERVALPDTFHRLLPVSGATLDGQPGATAALAWPQSGAPPVEVLALDDQGIRVVADADDPNSVGSGDIPAPPNLRGFGNPPTFRIAIRGAGLPLGVDPAAPPDADRARSVTTALVGIRSAADPNGPVMAEAALLVTSLPGTTIQPNPQLELRSAAGSTSFALSPGAERLMAIPDGALVLAMGDAQSCEQSARDCSGYRPSISLFDVAGAPRHVGTLPLPALPLPEVSNPGTVSVRWSHYDLFTPAQNLAFSLDAQHLAFVARASLRCTTPEDCAALGIDPAPFEQARVPQICAAVGADTVCESPALWGMGEREYVYALQIAGEGTPSWKALGVSTLEEVTLYPEGSSFGSPGSFNGTLAAVRRERDSWNPLLPVTQRRFMLDRFRLDASGAPQLLPSVNVPGYPVAFLGADARAEYWFSAEPLPDELGRARLHRLRITAAGAHSEQHLDLDSHFDGFWPIPIGDALFGLTLQSPPDACGMTRLAAIRLGTASSPVALEVASELELPSDEWSVLGIDGTRAVLRRGFDYVLIELDAAGVLRVVSARNRLEQVLEGQLAGRTLRGTDYDAEQRLEF